MTGAQQANRLTTIFSLRIPVVKRRISVCVLKGNKTAGQLRKLNNEHRNLQYSLDFTQKQPWLQIKESF